jgi:hypothetical protein
MTSQEEAFRDFVQFAAKLKGDEKSEAQTFLFHTQTEYDKRQPVLIDTNGAYRLATQWLAAIEFDVAALEKKYKPDTQRLWRLPPGFMADDNTNIIGVPRSGGGIDASRVPESDRVMLPYFEVRWGGDAARIMLAGTKKELMELQLQELDLGHFSLSRRPQMVITNAIELCRTPDPPGANRFQRAPPVRTNGPAQQGRPKLPSQTGN